MLGGLRIRAGSKEPLAHELGMRLRTFTDALRASVRKRCHRAPDTSGVASGENAGEWCEYGALWRLCGCFR